MTAHLGVCSQLSRCPEGLLLVVGGQCLSLVWVLLLLHFTCPSFPEPSAAALAQRLQTVTCSGHHGCGGQICSLRSGIWRAFPTQSRLGDCRKERGCQRLEVPVGLETEARLPGSASSSSFILYEERNGSHVTLLIFISLFLCKTQDSSQSFSFET